MLTVGYGWSSEILTFIVERLTGMTIEAYWYRHYVLSHTEGFLFLEPSV